METVEGFIKDAFEELKDIEQRLDAYASDEHVKRLLRLFGGDVTWTLKRDIIEMRIRNSFSLAKILRNRGDLEGAGEYFKTCWQMNRELGLLIGELSSWLLYVSVAVLKDGVQNAKVKTLEGEELSALDHFKRIWEIICEQPSRMTAELYVNVLSDYVLANLIINKKYPNDYNEEKFKMGGIHPPLLGLAYLVERANDLPHRCAKEEALKEPRELERQRPNTSVESVFSYILDFIINDDFDNASLHAEVAAKQRGPSTMIARLFSELAEATKARKLDEVLDKLTRLFYYHFAWNLG
ncbi:MAG: hypothetical protein H3Z52_09720 [archaeon]|nr:hypothetical protein [archaeon]